MSFAHYHRTIRLNGDKRCRRNYRTIVQTLEGRKAQMETRLSGQFVRWDALQANAGGDEAVRVQKDELLKDMRELLSNRTYVKNIVHDLGGDGRLTQWISDSSGRVQGFRGDDSWH